MKIFFPWTLDKVRGICDKYHLWWEQSYELCKKKFPLSDFLWGKLALDNRTFLFWAINVLLKLNECSTVVLQVDGWNVL